MCHCSGAPLHQHLQAGSALPACSSLWVACGAAMQSSLNCGPCMAYSKPDHPRGGACKAPSGSDHPEEGYEASAGLSWIGDQGSVCQTPSRHCIPELQQMQLMKALNKTQAVQCSSHSTPNACQDPRAGVRCYARPAAQLYCLVSKTECSVGQWMPGICSGSIP